MASLPNKTVSHINNVLRVLLLYEFSPYFLFPRVCLMFLLVYSIFIAGFKGKDCSVDIDLCSFGMCSEHTLICAETKGGHNVSCACERGEQAFSRCCICHVGV